MSKNPDFTKVPFVYEPNKTSRKEWQEAIEKRTNKTLDQLITETMEQVEVDPLYTAEAYKDMEHLVPMQLCM